MSMPDDTQSKQSHKGDGAWIFVSHSNRDIEKVREIRNELERRGYNPVLFFLKCMETPETDDRLLWQLIEREIKAREWFILCDSPNARNSAAVLREMELVKSMAREGKVVETILTSAATWRRKSTKSSASRSAPPSSTLTLRRTVRPQTPFAGH